GAGQANLIESSKQPGKGLSRVYIARIYFVLKQDEKGFKWLELACDENDVNLRQINLVPEFDHVRSDDRFRIILNRLNLK
ncbi:hypothetical protein ACFLR7_04785, partial [Acidobacteriota bacterium]